MKTKIFLVIGALLAGAIGYILRYPIDFHICSNVYQFNGYLSCSDETIMSIGSPLLIFSFYFLPIVLITVFTPRNIFISWLKLAVLVIPLLLIFISTQPVVGSFLSTNRDDTARLAGEIFTVLSLTLIVWKYYTSRRANSVKV